MITLEDYKMLMDTDSGYCCACETIHEYLGIEPDARNYECPECGKLEVFGLEECLIMGIVS